MTDRFAVNDNRFREYRSRNPGRTFAQYIMERECARLNEGRSGNPDGALAVGFGGQEEFWKAGEAPAAKLFRFMTPEPHHRVIDYGCGTLRVAAHFIRYLDRGGYLGLDIIDGFYEAGKKMLGAGLLAEKAPRFAVVSEESLAEASDFKADFVFSNTVCLHVHPDELPEYFGNLSRLTHVSGARLIFNAMLCNHPLRYEFAGWAWPIDFYRQSLRELEFVHARTGRPQDKAGSVVTPVNFEFRRR
jgi:SAM-dependent methyltransferase